MSELEPTEDEFIRQIVREEIRYSTPRLAEIEDVNAHTEEGDDSNYEVDVRFVGSINSRELNRVPVATSMDGATHGLEVGDLVLVEFLDGDGSNPVVTNTVYGDDDSGNRAPLTEPGDFRRRIGEDSIIEIITDEDGNRKLNLGRQPDDRDGIEMGLTFNLDDGGFCLMDGSQHGLFFDGDGNSILKWESMAMPILADGDVSFGSGGGGGGGTTGAGTGSNFSPFDAASDSGMDEAEFLAAGMSTTTMAAAESVREGDGAGLGLSPRLPTTWAQAALTASHIPEPTTSETVNLAAEGLSPGDVIDPYLEEYFRSDVRVEVPTGRYLWRGDGLTGNYQNAALVGRGGLVELRQSDHATHQATLTVPGGGAGSLLFSNVSFRGESQASGALLRVRVTDDLTSALLDGCYLPDGGSDDATIGIGVSPTHEGDLYLRNSVISGFPGGGLHASAPGMQSGGAGGQVFVEGGLYRANGTANVRIGSTESTLRSVTVVDSRSSPKPGVGIWLTEAGDDIVVEDCDVIQGGAEPPVHISSPTGTTAGTIADTRITNDSTRAPIIVASGHTWTGSNIHMTGDGPQTPDGGEFGIVTTDAAPASRVPRRID